MATIKVKRSPASRGKCKLAWNKVYMARVNPTYHRSYIIGNNVYLSEYFTIVTDQQPKPKPVLKTDIETGKLKVERDWSKPQAFPEGYVIKRECRAVKVGQTLDWIKKGAIGTIVPDGGDCPMFRCDDDSMYPTGWEEMRLHENIDMLAPLNPTDHPEHPDFGKTKPHANSEYDHSVEFTFKPFNTEAMLTPEPFDIREVIAEYIRQHGTQLTAIELIGHLTIDAQWQSTEK